MSLPAQPNQPENTSNGATASATPTPVTAAPTLAGPRNYFAMMLLAVLLLPTGLARAYRGDKSGWTRFWVYVGVTVASFIPVLGLIAVIPVLVLLVMGIVDVFQLRKVTTDATGAPLTMSPADQKWANGFFIYFIVGIVALGVLILLIASLAGYVMQQYSSGDLFKQMQNDTTIQSQYF